MTALHINIDHVATVRQARQISGPDPVLAAGLIEPAGADGITIYFCGNFAGSTGNERNHLL